jgi:hypothetical protein
MVAGNGAGGGDASFALYTYNDRAYHTGSKSTVREVVRRKSPYDRPLPVTSQCSSIVSFYVYYRSTVHVPRLHEVVDKRDNDGAAEHR